MTFDDPSWLFAVIGSVGTGGVVWGATRTKIARIPVIEKTIAKHLDDDHKVQLEATARLTRLETLVGEIHRVVVK